MEEFLAFANTHPILDVRSPAEYKQAHIPGAYSLPLFSDEERKIVGTAYKQQNRATAIKIGLDFFGPKMRSIVDTAESLLKTFSEKSASEKDKNFESKEPATRNPQPVTISQPVTILLHCWRGGMRSAAIAWLLDLYGFKIYTLAGGYKAYRNWALSQLQKEYSFKIIGGYTGSGKTLLLRELENQGNAIVDIEALANHKGSALGGLGKGTQPRQEMFENLLAQKLFKNAQKVIFVEDESQRIGDLQIPMPLWYNLRKSPVYFFDIPFEERLNYITEEYSVQSNEKLSEAILRIQKRLGGLETKNALAFLAENNYKECFRILLKYYDKYYLKGLYNRNNAAKLVSPVSSDSANPKINFLIFKDMFPQIAQIHTDTTAKFE